MAKVFCKKFNKELDAMMLPPIPGPKGEHIKVNFSQKDDSDHIGKSMQISLMRLNSILQK